MGYGDLARRLRPEVDPHSSSCKVKKLIVNTMVWDLLREIIRMNKVMKMNNIMIMGSDDEGHVEVNITLEG